MISLQGAIGRLQNRDVWLASRVQECRELGKVSTWYELDRESIATAISAIEFVIATQEYEQSQTKSATT